MNQTHITEIFALSSAGGSAEDQLRQYLQHARNTQIPLSIAGMRHTMGGQTFTPGGLVLNMLGLRQMHLDEERNILHVQAGACWSDVLHYLHARHRSIQVMQSNNSFSVGGSLGANCLPGGMMSDVWRVEAGNQRFVAKFYAYCVAENVTLGGSTPASNAENLAKSRQELERSLENLWET